jgi:hypothetical protein
MPSDNHEKIDRSLNLLSIAPFPSVGPKRRTPNKKFATAASPTSCQRQVQQAGGVSNNKQQPPNPTPTMIASLRKRQLLPLLLLVVVLLLAGGSCHAFLTPSSAAAPAKSGTTTQLNDWFDGRFGGKGSASKSDLDDQWEAQQEILRARRAPQSERDKYFRQVEERRAAASTKQTKMWSWQTKQYQKGEDPIDEWKKRRADGSISDLDNQYGDPKKIGGIPLPMASFGVGGEFGGKGRIITVSVLFCFVVVFWLG